MFALAAHMDEVIRWTALPLGKLAALVLLGAFLYRLGVLDPVAIRSISKIVVALTLPCLITTTILSRFRPQLAFYEGWYILPISAWLMVGSMAALSYPIALLARRWLHPRCTAATLAFHNAGYLVIPIISEIYGYGRMLQHREDMLAMLFLFILGISPLMWSIGVAALRSAESAADLPIWRKVISPPFVANVLAISLCLLGVPQSLPDRWLGVLLSPFKMVGDCTVPLMMLILGGLIAQLDKDHRPPARLWIPALALRLLVFPGLMFGLVSLMLMFDVMDRPKAIIIFIESAMPTAVAMAVIANRYGDEKTAQAVGALVFLEYVAAAITIPIWLVAWGLMWGYMLG